MVSARNPLVVSRHVILVASCAVCICILRARRRSRHRSQGDVLALEVILQIAVVLVVVVAEEEHGLDIVASQDQGLVGGYGCGYAPEPAVGYEHHGQAQGTVEIGL